jgi:mevalonate kinase
VKSAKELGVVAKISGAGYGDCGIAQINDKSVIEPLTKMWENEGIIILDIWRKDNE